MLNYLTSLPPLTWLFTALCLTAVLFIRLIWSARNNWMLSTSPGTRERANYQIAFGVIGLLVVMVLMLVVFIRSHSTNLAQDTTSSAPTEMIPATFVVLLPTSTPTATASPTPTAMPTMTPPPTVEASPTPTAAPTDTPTPTATATPNPTLPPPPTLAPSPTPELAQGQPPACPNPGARIIRPGDGAQVEGIVEVYGSANIENFDYYKLEFRGPGQDWSYVQHFNTPVLEGALGQWNSDTVPPGAYEFRLLVVDTLGNYPEPCTVRLAVQ